MALHHDCNTPAQPSDARACSFYDNFFYEFEVPGNRSDFCLSSNCDLNHNFTGFAWRCYALDLL